MAQDVTENTRIPRPPQGREDVATQISRLLEAHETILKECRSAASEAAEYGDDGTNDLIVSSLIAPKQPPPPRKCIPRRPDISQWYSLRR